MTIEIKTAESQTNGILKRLSIDDVISTNQVRKRIDNLEELAKSILVKGLQQPIIVTNPDLNGKHTIIQGERRWQACKLAGLTTIDAIVREAPQDNEDRIITQLTENIQREEMTCEDIAQAVAELHENNGLTLARIATLMGKNVDWAYVYYAVAQLPEPIKAFRDRYRINDPYILRPLKKMYNMDAEKTEEMLKMSEQQDIRLTRTVVKSLLRQLEDHIQTKQVPKSPVSEVESGLPKAILRGTKLATQPRIYCYVKLPGKNEVQMGTLVTDRVCHDGDFVCVSVQGELHLVEIGNVVLAGVLDSSDPIHNLY